MTKILLVAPSWVGDTVLAQPLFRRLHQVNQNLHLDVFASPYLHRLLSRMPEVTEVVTNPFKHSELRLFERYRLGKRLAERHYDQAIVLPNSIKSALVPFFVGIPKRTGFLGEMRFLLLNDAKRLDADRLPLMVDRFLNLADEASTPTTKESHSSSLQTSAENLQKTLNRLQLTSERPIAAFCPGAEYGPAKRWPAKYFAALGDRLSERGYAIWIFGSKNDIAIAQEIVSHSAHCIDLTGKTELDEAIDLLSACSLVVSNDSGLMHVASALDKPLIAIYGSSNPGFTPPISHHARVIKLDLECSPCFKRECPLGHFNCMMALTPDLVFEKIVEFLN